MDCAMVVIKHRRYSIRICWVTALQTHTFKCLVSTALCIFLWNLKFNISKIIFLHKTTSLFWLFFCATVTTVLIIQTWNRQLLLLPPYLFFHIQVIAKYYRLNSFNVSQVYPSFSIPQPICMFSSSLSLAWASIIDFKPGVLSYNYLVPSLKTFTDS